MHSHICLDHISNHPHIAHLQELWEGAKAWTLILVHHSILLPIRLSCAISDRCVLPIGLKRRKCRLVGGQLSVLVQLDASLLRNLAHSMRVLTPRKELQREEHCAAVRSNCNCLNWQPALCGHRREREFDLWAEPTESTLPISQPS